MNLELRTQEGNIIEYLTHAYSSQITVPIFGAEWNVFRVDNFHQGHTFYLKPALNQGQLKCCPFCGSMAAINEGCEGEDSLDEVWIISCNDCQCQMVGQRNDKPCELFPDEKEQMIKDWNNRESKQ